MTELDFDELDKAVNSLMSNNGNGAVQEGATPTIGTVPTVNDQVNSSQVPPISTLNDQNVSPSPTVTPDRSSPLPDRSLAVKRRGRFMDIVHPSVDMQAAVPPIAKREGVSLEPEHDVIEPESPVAPAEQPIIAAPIFDMEATGGGKAMTDTVFDTSQQKAVEPNAVTSEPISAWPDPIDMMSDQPSDPTPAASELAATTTMPASPNDDEDDDINQIASSLTSDTPLLSPFIPNAVVEKRPLGGTSIETVDSSVELTASDSGEGYNTPVDLPTPPVELPEELKGDVLTLESSNTATQRSGSLADTPSVVPDPVEENLLPSPDQTREPIPETVQPTMVSAKGDISQQYAEKPSSGDQTNGAIYDTADYHQPLEHPEKKKSGWGLVIAIIALLIIGALGAIAYFYFTTPSA